MNKDNVINELLIQIPEIRPFYEKEMEYWDEVLPHIVFGDVLIPVIKDLLKKRDDVQLIHRIFNFLEKMAICPDIYVKEVLITSVLEVLGDEPKFLKFALEFMGSRTKELSDGIETFLGRKP